MTTSRDPRNRVLLALMLTMALVAMDTTIVATAIPQVVEDLGGLAKVGWVFSAYLLAQTVTIPVYGKLADQYGRKPILIVGVIIFIVGSAMSAAAWDMTTLIVFRAVQGLGAGSIGATVNTLAGDLYDIVERGKVQGWLSSVWGVSAVVAPALGGFFAQYLSWRWIFLVNLPLGGLALLLIIRNLHEQVQRRRHRVDYAGALLVLLAVGLLILGLLQGGIEWAWWSPQIIVVFGGALLAFVLVVIVERRAPNPIMPPWLWSRRLTGGTYVATMLAGLVIIGLATFLPTWGQAVLGLSAVWAGFMLAVMSMTWPLASALSNRLYLRIGFRDTALIGGVLMIIASVVFVATTADTSVWQPTVGVAILGAGMGLMVSPLVVGIQSTVGWEERGVITGGAMFSRSIGQAIGAAVFGAVTNAVLARRLATAPADLAGRLPSTVGEIGDLLVGTLPSPEVAAWLRESLHASTHAVFVGLLLASVATVVVLALVVPRRFPLVAQAADTPSPVRHPA